MPNIVKIEIFSNTAGFIVKRYKKSAPEETPFRIEKQEDYSFVLYTSLDTVTMGHTSL